MAVVTIKDVQYLRKMTGAGMMNCKDALSEAGGDYNRAVEIIRKKGHSVAVKRQNCEISEGCVLASIKGDFAAIVSVKCETDFVAKEAGFVSLVEKILYKSLENQPKAIEDLKSLVFEGRKIQELLEDKMGIMAEKIELSTYEYVRALSVVSYVHPGNKLAVIVGFNQVDVDNQLAKDVAMQVAAMDPISVDKDSVPMEIVLLEKKIARERAIEQGKPCTMLKKIEEGSLNKYFKENTLMQQASIKDSKSTVRDLLNRYSNELQVTGFKRVSLSKN